MRQDKILERLSRKGTTTASNMPVHKAAAVDQSIFEPKQIKVYDKKTNLDQFLSLPTRQLPPVILRTPSSVEATITKDYLLTEAGDFLMTEDNNKLIQ